MNARVPTRALSGMLSRDPSLEPPSRVRAADRSVFASAWRAARGPVPGERREVEFFADGHVEVERFRSTTRVGEGLQGEDALEDLLTKHTDTE